MQNKDTGFEFAVLKIADICKYTLESSCLACQSSRIMKLVQKVK